MLGRRGGKHNLIGRGQAASKQLDLDNLSPSLPTCGLATKMGQPTVERDCASHKPTLV